MKLGGVGNRQCPYEDYRGRRCALGDQHTVACRFGAARLTEEQVRQLRQLIRLIPFGGVPSDQRTAESLVRLALVWRKDPGIIVLSPYGERVARGLPE
jgi:hypothetical protein